MSTLMLIHPWARSRASAAATEHALGAQAGRHELHAGPSHWQHGASPAAT